MQNNNQNPSWLNYLGVGSGGGSNPFPGGAAVDDYIASAFGGNAAPTTGGGSATGFSNATRTLPQGGGTYNIPTTTNNPAGNSGNPNAPSSQLGNTSAGTDVSGNTNDSTAINSSPVPGTNIPNADTTLNPSNPYSFLSSNNGATTGGTPSLGPEADTAYAANTINSLYAGNSLANLQKQREDLLAAKEAALINPQGALPQIPSIPGLPFNPATQGQPAFSEQDLENLPQPTLDAIDNNLGQVNTEISASENPALAVLGLGSGGSNGTGSGTNGVVGAYTATTSQGKPYIDPTAMTGLDPTTVGAINALAKEQGIPTLTPDQATSMKTITAAKSQISQVVGAVSGLLAKTPGFNIAKGTLNSLGGIAGDPSIKAYDALRLSAIDYLKANAGGAGSGLRINEYEVNSALAALPIIDGPGADTLGSAQTKINYAINQLNNIEDSVIPPGGSGTSGFQAGNGTGGSSSSGGNIVQTAVGPIDTSY